jgi:nucleotide-binding universal stress UspA family protein
MLPIHTILHPTDFSEQSRYALALARTLARGCGARLILLHVGAPWAVVGHADLIPVLTANQEELKEQLRRLTPDADFRVEHRFERGDPASEILRVAQETHADLIVMGTHGRTGMGRLLMGSVAEQVLRQAACPVVMVKTSLRLRDTESSSNARAV